MTEAQIGQSLIFISYRRTDAGWPADRLASKLQSTFGENRVFMDARTIEAGDDFEAVLEDKLRLAAVLVVLIGKGWLFVQDKYGRRRLDQSDDWVRKEIRISLQRRESCRVIPVLIDDAELPSEKDALPEEIAGLLALQRIQVRQTNSDDDMEALSRELVKAGFGRLRDITEPLADDQFSDKEVLEVVANLRKLQQRQGTEFVSRLDLLRELDRLFNRKTFRFEPLRQCPEQRWADRLHSAYQTEKVLRAWERNVREVAADRHSLYIDLIKEVGSYCMQMGALLFEPAVDYNRIEDHIGKPTFKPQLPAAIWFDTGSDKQPIIPDEVNNLIERHRKRAVALMNRLVQE